MSGEAEYAEVISFPPENDVDYLKINLIDLTLLYRARCYCKDALHSETSPLL